MEIGTLSGAIIQVETIIWVNKHLEEDRADARKNGFHFATEEVLVPEGQRTGGVPAPIYDAFSIGSERACADIVITTYLPNGWPAVIAIKRAKNKPFGGKWWVQGGSYHTYRLRTDFLLERAEKECGVRPLIEGLIGEFRTCAQDFVCSTTNACYVGFAPYDVIIKARVDRDHSSLRLLTYRDLEELPPEEVHWYPMFVFRQALTTML